MDISFWNTKSDKKTAESSELKVLGRAKKLQTNSARKFMRRKDKVKGSTLFGSQENTNWRRNKFIWVSFNIIIHSFISLRKKDGRKSKQTQKKKKRRNFDSLKFKSFELWDTNPRFWYNTCDNLPRFQQPETERKMREEVLSLWVIEFKQKG